ncbi:MAG: B12-binding domain-containing radical SAM protein [Planctomycetota bacterium]
MSKIFLVAAGMLSPKKTANVFSKKHCYVNYGILRLASVLYESGFDAIVVQGLFYSPEEIVSRLTSLGYHGSEYPVLLSVPTFFAVPWASKFSRLLKALYPDQCIFVGGRWVVNNRVDWIYSKIPETDLVICGTSDDYIVDLVTKHNYKFQTTNKGNKYLFANSKMPTSFLRYELLDEAYRFHPSIEISRGCGRGCSFCVEGRIGLTSLQEPDLVVENLKYLRSLYNHEPFYTYFQASNFCPTQNWASSLHREYARNELDCLWRCEIRVDTISPNTLKLLARSGLRVIDIGLESASRSQLKRMKKTSDPDSYLEKADMLLKTASESGILTKLNVMLYPGETHETINETISWLRRRETLIKGVSSGSLILFETQDKVERAVSEFRSLGTSLAYPEMGDPDGVFRLNLSDEISYDVAEEYSSDICKMFMSDEDYFDLKSFCYFPRDYRYVDYRADIAATRDETEDGHVFKSRQAVPA